MLRIGIAAVVVSAIGAGCTDTSSFTNLNPDGPPAIAEVVMRETYSPATNPNSFMFRRVFGFGTFPDATPDVDHAVTTASSTMQGFRVIMDELLIGNSLEEIQCRGVIDGDTYSSVPLGATPDDIAACAVNNNALKASCHGDHAVCICALDAGCSNSGGAVAKGEPVGVLDQNADGAADNTAFKAGAVTISCQNDTIDVPLDLDMSYWNPSGNQQVPAMGGYDALGPAIVLIPQGGFMPTNSTCGLKFAASVTDKQNNRVCAPASGRPASCTGAIEDCKEALDCTAGDTSAFTFGTEALRVNFIGVRDGDMNVSITTPIFISANAPLSEASIQNITITPSTGVGGPIAISLPMPTQIKLTPVTSFTPSTAYTVTIPTTVTDAFGQPLPAPLTITFTTGTM